MTGPTHGAAGELGGHDQIGRHRPSGHQQLELCQKLQFHCTALRLPAACQLLGLDGDLQPRRQGQPEKARGAAVQGGDGQGGWVERQRLPPPWLRQAGAAHTTAPPAVIAEAGIEADRQGAAVVRGQRHLHPRTLSGRLRESPSPPAGALWRQ